MVTLLSTAALTADKYEVLSLLGQGSAGLVHKARRTELDTVRALKRVSENSVLGAARLQAPCPALSCIAGSLRIRLLRAPWAGRFRSGFDLRVNFQTLSKVLVMEYIQGQTPHDDRRYKGALPYIRSLPKNTSDRPRLRLLFVYHPS